jgi:membrane protease YdiL (CAAX protease family)
MTSGDAPAQTQCFEQRISRVPFWPLLLLWYGSHLAVLGVAAALPFSNGMRPRVDEMLAVCVVFAWWMWKAAPRPYSFRATLGRRPGLSSWGVALGALLGLWCADALCLGLPHLWDRRGGESLPARLVFGMPHADTALDAVLLTVVLKPIVEELLFRGTLFRKWRVRLGPQVAALLATLIFALFHPNKLLAFAGGLTYLLVYTRTRSLWAPMGMHIVNNGVARGITTLMAWGGYRFEFDTHRLPVVVVVAVLGAAAWVYFVCQSWRTLGGPLPPESSQGEAEARAESVAEPLGVHG